MKTAVLGLLAETSIHPGSGRSLGVVDLPVAREKPTDYPVMVGSSLKGALRDRTETQVEDGEEVADRLYGKRDNAGELLISDGRLLLLPVRSLTGAFQWVTCPHLIERYARDLRRAGWTRMPEVLEAIDLRTLVSDRRALVAGAEATDGKLFLEELEFTITREMPAGLVDAVARIVPHPQVRERIAGQLAVIGDDSFAWFARYGLPINARNRLDDDTKQSRNLWYEETLPPDTVMYALIIDRTRNGHAGGALENLRQTFLGGNRYLQAGGNETVGHGWFAVALLVEEMTHDEKP
jgi:CRISPR-associated protein Cmr4